MNKDFNEIDGFWIDFENNSNAERMDLIELTNQNDWLESDYDKLVKNKVDNCYNVVVITENKIQFTHNQWVGLKEEKRLRFTEFIHKIKKVIGNNITLENKLTPNEKAKKLITDFLDLGLENDLAIECALKVVDEFLLNDFEANFDWWRYVKIKLLEWKKEKFT